MLGNRSGQSSGELCDSTGEITNYKAIRMVIPPLYGGGAVRRRGLFWVFYSWLGLKAKVLP